MSFWVEIEIALEGFAASDASQGCEAQANPLNYTSRFVKVRSGLPLIRLGEQGCIAGYLFRRERPCGQIFELDEAATSAALASRGASLLRDYWGGYVALLETGDGAVDVFRDPSGLLPCYIRRTRTGVHLASDMTALATPGRERIDFAVVAKMLASVDALGRRTAVAGIEELLSGERLRVDRRGTCIDLAWSPWDHIGATPQRSFAENSELLRTTVKDAVGAWTTCFDSILLGVSGGVDSSIVAAASVPRTPGLRCLTFVEPLTEGDERRYAEALTAKLGVRLAAPQLDLAAVELTRATLPHFSVPIALPIMQAVEAIHQEQHRQKPVDAYFTGNGGDNIFCNMHSGAPFADRLLTAGPMPGLWRTARDLSELTGSALGDVIAHGWRRVRTRRAPHPILFDLTGLTPAAAADAIAADDRHPWLSAPSGALPGQKAYVAMQARGQKSIELYPRRTAPPQIAPLLSQPIAELCLSIPTWQAIEGGRDRAVARAAFAADLPPLIVNRRTKGSPSGFLRRLFDAQLPKAIDLLRGGRLVEAGLLDPTFIERVGDGAWRDDGRHHRLLAFCSAETWVRWWESGSPEEGEAADAIRD